ncbi:MAG: transporter substrate-binding domain-containing protein [Candidimonas sp.]|nr:MAG: transporter substrate-binding domain-containing protein [Candidimonas sp.]TAM23051.1 MAG: transporter substrate-binding domain-containing protein [Candidimonas sp.]TAM80842.1 MAG: transporter substrate-binding domain-containing protein [Candidimonas sp.]
MRLFSTLKLCLATACLVTAALPVHAEDQLASVKKAGVLVVGTEMQFAPFDFLKDGKQEGFNKEFFAQVGKALGVKVRFIDLPWPSVLPGLDAKKFDMVAGPLNVTKARMEHYTFTLPIADGTVALLKRTSDTALKKPEDIAGKAVGGGKGSAQLAQLRDFANTLTPKPIIKEYIDNNQAYADLAAGRIVAVGNSLTNIAYVAKQRPKMFSVVKPAFGKKVYFAYIGLKNADAKPLLDAVDKVILAMHKDGRLAAMQKKWFGQAMDVPVAPFVPNV